MIKIARTFVSDQERLNTLLTCLTENDLACNYYKVAAGFIVNIYSIRAGHKKSGFRPA